MLAQGCVANRVLRPLNFSARILRTVFLASPSLSVASIPATGEEVGLV